MSTLILYRQADPKWGSELLGYNTEPGYTLSAFGCLVSAVAMLVSTVTQDTSWTPERVNNYLKDSAGFAPGGGLLRWSQLGVLFPYLVFDHTVTSRADMDVWLSDSQDNYALVKVNNGAHYVLCPYASQMADPADGKLKSAFGSYAFNEARLYKFVGGRGAAINAQEGNVYVDQAAYDDLVKWKADGENFQRLLNEELAKTAELQAVLADTRAQLATAGIPVATESASVQPIASPEWEATFRAITPVLVERAEAGGTMTDFSGKKPIYSFVAGTVFHLAGRFTVTGKTYYRTERSTQTGDWYGVSADMFPGMPELGTTARGLSADQLHLGAATAFGLIKKAEAGVVGLFTKKKEQS